MKKYTYKVDIAEIYFQGYIVESDTPLTKEEAMSVAFNEGVLIEDDFSYSHSVENMSKIREASPTEIANFL